jgi:hypothetical protein
LHRYDFKIYRNLYNKTLRAGKKLYYEKELGKNISNLKKTWDIIKSSLNLASKRNDSFSEIFVNGVKFSDPLLIACKMNEYFAV